MNVMIVISVKNKKKHITGTHPLNQLQIISLERVTKSEKAYLVSHMFPINNKKSN